MWFPSRLVILITSMLDCRYSVRLDFPSSRLKAVIICRQFKLNCGGHGTDRHANKLLCNMQCMYVGDNHWHHNSTVLLNVLPCCTLWKGQTYTFTHSKCAISIVWRKGGNTRKIQINESYRLCINIHLNLSAKLLPHQYPNNLLTN